MGLLADKYCSGIELPPGPQQEDPRQAAGTELKLRAIGTDKTDTRIKNKDILEVTDARRRGRVAEVNIPSGLNKWHPL